MSQFLSVWEQYVSQCTDASWDYIHAGGLAALSTVALGRRTIARGSGVRPNVFVMITGPSSAKRKTTIVRHVIDVVNEITPERIGPNDFTPEYLVAYMRKRASGKSHNRLLLPIKEFGTILAQQRTYAATLAPMLCDLYDGDDYRRGRVGKKMMVVEKPRLSMISACAYAMIEEYGSAKDWSNGFFSRMLWVAPNYNRPTFSSEPTPNPALRKQVIAALGSIHKYLSASASKRLDVEQGADQVFDQFATWLGHQYNETDLTRGAYAARLLTNVWKVALLYQIDEDPDRKISVAAVTRATMFARDCWNSFETVYRLVAGTDYSRGLQKLRNFIRSAGIEGVPRSTALRAFHASAHVFQSHLDLLTRNGEVEIRNVAVRGARGRAATRQILFYLDDAIDARVEPEAGAEEGDELAH
jgi:hypothetical protein